MLAYLIAQGILGDGDALVAATFITAVIGPMVVAVVGFVKARAVAQHTKTAVEEVKTSLTTNNGGSTTKDALDEIRGALVDLSNRLTVIEEKVL